MLNANDGENGDYSYLDIAEIIRTKGVNIKEDLKELWSRMLFSILISNTDDHLRNHGFLKQSPNGWSLSPLYDVNPSVDRTSNLQLNIDETSSATSIDLAFSVADYFGLSKPEADKILKQQIAAVSEWKDIAQHFGIGNAEISRLNAAFRKISTK